MPSKFFKKFSSILNSEKIDKIISAIKNQLNHKKDENRAEAFAAITLFFQTCKEKNWQFPRDTYRLLFHSIDDDNWMIRRNALNTIRNLCDLYPVEIIDDYSIKKIKEMYQKDPNWACRNAAIEVLGKIGEDIPNRIVPFLTASEQIDDPDNEVRLSILTALKAIYMKNHDKLDNILPIFVKAYKNDEDSKVSQFAEDAIKEFAEIKKEEGTAYKKVDVEHITCLHCQQSVPSNKDLCQNCGQPLPVCQICNDQIKTDEELVTCSHCNTHFHLAHIKEWCKENKNCPVCYDKIDFKG